MTDTPKLDHRIATAEGMYQAEVHRREKAERKLDEFVAQNARLLAERTEARRIAIDAGHVDLSWLDQ